MTSRSEDRDVLALLNLAYGEGFLEAVAAVTDGCNVRERWMSRSLQFAVLEQWRAGRRAGLLMLAEAGT
jgi:hypothetical protein